MGFCWVFAFLVLIEDPSFESVYCLNVFFVSFLGLIYFLLVVVCLLKHYGLIVLII